MREQPADLVVLDLMLPGIDGLEVCRRLREAERRADHHADRARQREPTGSSGSSSAPTTTSTKPFSPRELVLRVDSVLRRTGRSAPARRRCSSTATWCVDRRPARRHPRRATLSLTAREFDLLRFLVAHPGMAFSRDDLLQQVWGWSFGDHSTVTVHVRRLREKVEPDPTRPGAAGDGLGRRLPLGGRVVSDSDRASRSSPIAAGGRGSPSAWSGCLALAAAPRARCAGSSPLVAAVAVLTVFVAGTSGIARRDVPLRPRPAGRRSWSPGRGAWS